MADEKVPKEVQEEFDDSLDKDIETWKKEVRKEIEGE
jgi:hypothetical protein